MIASETAEALVECHRNMSVTIWRRPFSDTELIRGCSFYQCVSNTTVLAAQGVVQQEDHRIVPPPLLSIRIHADSPILMAAPRTPAP